MDFKSQRNQMVSAQIEARGISNERVLNAMRKIERHLFMSEDDWHHAYEDHPVFIGSGQTISQPYIVALMSEALDLKGDEKILEIGTGSGYQTAILAELTSTVFTVERIPKLSSTAEQLLNKLGYSNIQFKIGDGSVGWVEKMPYDGIIVTAASPVVPKSLLSQLRVGGKLIIPVGNRFTQTLQLVTKWSPSELRFSHMDGVMFVPLIGNEGWRDEG